MGVLRAVVQVAALGELADDEPGEDHEDDAPVEGFADQVDGLVVDAVQLLEPLQVVLRRRRVGDRPQAQVVHVAQLRKAVLEGDAQAELLVLHVLVLEGRHRRVACVRDRLAQVLPRRLQVRQLVHFDY